MQTSELLRIYFNGNAAALAAAAGVSRQAPRQWGDKIPAERVIPICEALNWRVTPHILRSDLYPNGLDGIPASLKEVA